MSGADNIIFIKKSFSLLKIYKAHDSELVQGKRFPYGDKNVVFRFEAGKHLFFQNVCDYVLIILVSLWLVNV